MNLSAPMQITWWIAVIVGLAGILANAGMLPFLAAYAFWLVVIGFVLLVLATLVKNL
jgi:heme/copper-type cytochrome/quinol oxidase subunit 1